MTCLQETSKMSVLAISLTRAWKELPSPKSRYVTFSFYRKQIWVCWKGMSSVPSHLSEGKTRAVRHLLFLPKISSTGKSGTY